MFDLQEDDRCAVRPFEDGDVELLLPLVAPEAGAPANGLPRPSSPRDAAAWASGVLEEHAAGRGRVSVASAGGRGLVGTTKIRALDPERRSAELSYWIAERHRGRGYGTAAARLTVACAFGPWGFVRLYAHAFEQNAASRAVLSRLGFRCVGTVACADPAGGDEPATALVHLLEAGERGGASWR